MLLSRHASLAAILGHPVQQPLLSWEFELLGENGKPAEALLAVEVMVELQKVDAFPLRKEVDRASVCGQTAMFVVKSRTKLLGFHPILEEFELRFGTVFGLFLPGRVGTDRAVHVGAAFDRMKELSLVFIDFREK